MNYLHSYVNDHLNVKIKHFLLLKLTNFKYHRAFYTLDLILAFRAEKLHLETSVGHRENLLACSESLGGEKSGEGFTAGLTEAWRSSLLPCLKNLFYLFTKGNKFTNM